MKKLITLTLIALYAGVMAGCTASADVKPTHSDDSSSYKKTTVTSDNGEKTTKTETHTSY